MRWFKSKSTHSRLFIHNIHVTSNKFVNWDPSTAIEVRAPVLDQFLANDLQLGDYGKVDKSTGEFKKYGNIFNDGKTDEQGTAKLKRTAGAQTSYEKFCSVEVREIAFDSVGTIGNPILVDAAFKARFKIGSGGGSVLLLHTPVTAKLEGPIEDILTHNCDHLRNRHLVTEIVTCPAYAMHLSINKSDTFRIGLHADVPIPIPCDVKAGGKLVGRWYHEGHSDVLKCGSELGERYVALYYLMEIGKKGNLRRDSTKRDLTTLGQPCWVPSRLPWRMLDEEGNEESDEDEDDDDDEGKEEQASEDDQVAGTSQSNE